MSQSFPHGLRRRYVLPIRITKRSLACNGLPQRFQFRLSFNAVDNPSPLRRRTVRTDEQKTMKLILPNRKKRDRKTLLHQAASHAQLTGVMEVLALDFDLKTDWFDFCFPAHEIVQHGRTRGRVRLTETIHPI